MTKHFLIFYTISNVISIISKTIFGLQLGIIIVFLFLFIFILCSFFTQMQPVTPKRKIELVHNFATRTMFWYKNKAKSWMNLCLSSSFVLCIPFQKLFQTIHLSISEILTTLALSTCTISPFSSNPGGVRILFRKSKFILNFFLPYLT